MEEQGTVIRAGDGEALVRVTPSAACGGCSQQSACHPANGERTITVRDPIGVRPGQIVTIGLPGGGIRVALGLAYGVPLAALLGGALLGYRLAPAGADLELVAALAALAGLGAAFLLLKMLRGRYEGLRSLKPVVLRIGG